MTFYVYGENNHGKLTSALDSCLLSYCTVNIIYHCHTRTCTFNFFILFLNSIFIIYNRDVSPLQSLVAFYHHFSRSKRVVRWVKRAPMNAFKVTVEAGCIILSI